MVQEVTVLARDIRAGDVFDRHRKTWTAVGAAGWTTLGSVAVPVAGGAVYLVADEQIKVRRLAQRIPCSATE
ncbi:hypothetical protein [Streptomyces sp. NPDC058280]|uniref:hypothetical protein n=1 Tax=Streptomyces sp. NPDC058280 TaxID=3346419 RepID=UPI0036E43848